MATAAFATISYPPEGGTWNYGVVSPGNNYYMGYSYYYHATKTHRSSVAEGGSVWRSPDTLKGYTSQINSPSLYKKYDFSCYYAVLN